MAKCVSTPNILWRIENFESTYKKSGPTIKFLGRKFRLNISQPMEAGVPKLQLIMECLSASQASKPLLFNIDACVLYGGRYMLKTGKYNSTHSEWCVWTDLVPNIHKTLGQITDVTFLIMITPTGNFGDILSTDNNAQETKEMTPCAFSFREDIGNLFNNDELSDFTIICGDKKFLVHKAILSARSHYFDGMFRHDMKEVNEKKVTIEKMEPEILELVLRYLYTGELPPLSMKSLQKVCAAAGRFIVEPLKIKCHSLFIEAFTTESDTDSEKVTKIEQPELGEQSEIVKKEIDDTKKEIDDTKKEVDDTKERQMLKNLFMSREWRLFSEEFPHKAHEMCKPYFPQEL